MNTKVQGFLKCVIPGKSTTHRNLSIVPLFLKEKGKETYMTLSEGLASGLVEIEEVSRMGDVNHIKIKNKSKRKLFVADGEEIAGAKQNRVVNHSMLLDGQSETVVSASCTEEGRWNYLEEGQKFTDTGHLMARRARQYNAVRLQKNLQKKDKYAHSQKGVWDDINDYFKKLNTNTQTKALKDAFDQNSGDLEQFVYNCAPLDGQCGMAAFINNDLLGIDVLSQPSAYKILHPKFIKSCAIEALTLPTTKIPDPTQLQTSTFAFIESLLDATETQHKPVGLGIDYRYLTNHATASALVYIDEVLHFSAHKNDAKSTALMERKQAENPIDKIVDLFFGNNPFNI